MNKQFNNKKFNKANLLIKANKYKTQLKKAENQEEIDHTSQETTTTETISLEMANLEEMANKNKAVKEEDIKIMVKENKGLTTDLKKMRDKINQTNSIKILIHH